MPTDDNHTVERVEFALHHRREKFEPRAPGSPLPLDAPSKPENWQVLDMPVAVANICREIARRGHHGVHISALGGPDMLAELDLHAVPYRVVGAIKRGMWDKVEWVVPDAIYRFAGDREAVAN